MQTMVNTNKAKAALQERAATKTKPARGSKPTPRGGPAEPTIGTGLYVLNKRAVSLDVGPKIINEWFNDDKRIDVLTSEINNLKGQKRYDRLTDLTLAVVKAAENDSRIDLADIVGSDKKAKEKLNALLGVALGFRVVKQSEPDRNGTIVDVIVNAPAVAESFPMPGENEKNCPDFQKKTTFRSNFTTQMNKVIQAALGIIEKGITAKRDKSGTLMISGPEVKKHFGADNVLLNEKQKVGEGDNKVELAAKPSFTELAVMGATSLGANVSGGDGGQHRSRQTGTVRPAVAEANKAIRNQTPAQACAAICGLLVKAIEKITDKLDKTTIDALESASNAIEVVLENG
jgi:hypothetical protein